MSSTTTPAAVGPSSIAIDAIHVAVNIRELRDEHVATLAESIALVGVLQPLIVRPAEEGFELVAGFRRLAAARRVGLAEVPVVVRDAATEDADRAVENVVSCRRRHEVIYADRVVMPMSELRVSHGVRRDPVARSA